MAIHKIVLNDDFAEEYTLVAIHCSEEPYKMAFSLNKYLNLKLQRQDTDLQFSTKELDVTFPIFEFEDQFQYTTYYLVANKCKSKIGLVSTSEGLFREVISERMMTTYLLPELKQADFFLKIESDLDHLPLRKIVASLNEIKEVISAYSIDHQKIKNKNHLIFN